MSSSEWPPQNSDFQAVFLVIQQFITRFDKPKDKQNILLAYSFFYYKTFVIKIPLKLCQNNAPLCFVTAIQFFNIQNFSATYF